MNSNQEPEEYIHYHKDGTVWAKGQMIGDISTGYWEWFRKDGTIMRSGYFLEGIQVGQWITYDKKGAVYKVTDMKDGKKNSQRTKLDKSEK
jgi:antitoxin component YwqK of YwqJK toxin-antitoxin module